MLDALPGSVGVLWGLGTLLVFAVGGITLARWGLARPSASAWRSCRSSSATQAWAAPVRIRRCRRSGR
ncbi:hypothetical protein [Streptomyces sp. ISL-10]|uniref:hypothetical protein n=1 Tax=Streptomyces sp. ISL-10 TaxID=2819172 RepID=UPI0035ABF7EF